MRASIGINMHLEVYQIDTPLRKAIRSLEQDLRQSNEEIGTCRARFDDSFGAGFMRAFVEAAAGRGGESAIGGRQGFGGDDELG
jgi:hypothetical protein